MMTPELQARCSSGSEEGAGIPVPAPVLDRWAHEWDAIPGGCEPDLSPDDIGNGRLARIIEETRMRFLFQQRAKNAAGKLKDECISSQVRNEMRRDGVMSQRITGVGAFKLYPPKTVQPCESCLGQFSFGGGTLDPYLGVYPEAAK